MNYFKTLSAILVTLLVISGCGSKKTNDKPTNEAVTVDTAQKTIPVKVLSLAKAKIARTIDYTATVLPFEEVNMAPSTPGRVEKIYVEVGDRVSKGDPLFLMDRTQLYQLKLQLTNLEKDLNRIDTLLKAGSAKQQQYDQMKTQYDVTKTNVDFMEQNTLLKSPFAGVVTGKYFENGEMIGHGFLLALDGDGNIRIAFLYRGTQAHNLGIKRGWIVKKVNETTATANNVFDLLGPSETGRLNTISFLDENGEPLELSLTKEVIQITPVICSKVIRQDETNIGYMVFQDYIDAANEELDTLFTSFAAAGIDEMIVDLRYNGFGISLPASCEVRIVGFPVPGP